MQSEYSRKITALNKDNFETMNKITKYFVSFIIDKTDRTNIIDGLLDTALENQENGISLRKVIGKDIKAYCDNLLKNCRKISLAEKLVMCAFILSSIFAIVFLLSYIIFLDQTVPMVGILNITLPLSDLVYKITFALVFLIMVFLYSRFSFRSKLQRFLVYFFGVSIIIVTRFKSGIILNEAVISFNSLFITLLFAAIALILYLVRLVIVKKSRLTYRK